MKNFESLFAAWMVVWAVFFVYEVSVARRLAKLRDDIERLKQQTARRLKKPPASLRQFAGSFAN